LKKKIFSVDFIAWNYLNSDVDLAYCYCRAIFFKAAAIFACDFSGKKAIDFLIITA